jgi:hypothetical protein
MMIVMFPGLGMENFCQLAAHWSLGWEILGIIVVGCTTGTINIQPAQLPFSVSVIPKGQKDWHHRLSKPKEKTAESVGIQSNHDSNQPQRRQKNILPRVGLNHQPLDE